MGDSVNNLTFRFHMPEGSSTLDVILNRHKGSISVDTDSPSCTQAEWEAIRAAGLTGSDQDLDDACGDAFGSWYVTHIVNVNLRDHLRSVIQAIA